MRLPYTHPLPSDLINHVTQTLGETGEKWLGDLPAVIDELSVEWSLVVDEPFAAGEFNFVAPAIRNGQERVVLKIAPPFENGEYASETAWLRQRSGAGCIHLLTADSDTRAMLLERAFPGCSLAEGLTERTSGIVEHAIHVLKVIQMTAPNDATEVIILSNWFSNLERAPGTVFPTDYVGKALDYYAALSRDAPLLYLHGDFHPGNIVTATRSPYLAIDPKGIIGPLGYDIAVFLNNLYWGQGDDIAHAQVKTTLARAVAAFSAAFNIPEVDLRRWAFAVQVLGAWWTFDEMPALYSGGVAKADIWDV